MLVSFIIPSYNSAHTVRRCLDSIYALSLKTSELEVIFTDDCSTDDTCDIVSEYQSRHPNITLLRQPKNNRQGAARNRGVTVAKGKHICFVDSDDAVEEGIVSAIRASHDLQTDMTAFHTTHANEYDNTTNDAQVLTFNKGQIFSGLEMQNRHAYWCSASWGYIYKADYLRKVNYTFAEGVLYEDSDFVATHLYYAKRMTYSPDLGYIAYYREGSTTHSNNYKNTADYLLLGSRMLALYAIIQQDIDEGKRNDDGIQEFADGILEGAIHNVTMSIKRLFKLNSGKEIVAYYNRIDAKVNRRAIYSDKRMHKYPNYWNIWVTLCINCKYISIVLNSCLSIAYQLYVKHKKQIVMFKYTKRLMAKSAFGVKN